MHMLIKSAKGRVRGFTIVELLIVIVVISILATIVIAAYNGMQQRSARSVATGALKQAQNEVNVNTLSAKGAPPSSLPATVKIPDDVEMHYQIPGNYYNDLSAVQNGVLFQSICEELVNDPEYSTIHSADGNQTSNVVMRCDDSISANSLLITGWNSRTWNTPLNKAPIEAYMASVPYDSWWVDKQDVIRGFYQALIDTFEERGGTWPITSFWDPWANQWSGVPKEELPEPVTDKLGGYCIQATHLDYPDTSYIVTNDDQDIREGTCL